MAFSLVTVYSFVPILVKIEGGSPLQYLGKHPNRFFIRPIKKPFNIEFQITENKDNPLPFSI